MRLVLPAFLLVVATASPGCGGAHRAGSRVRAIAPFYSVTCVLTDTVAVCPGTGADLRAPGIEIWEDQFASGQFPCIRAEGVTRCYDPHEGWAPIAPHGDAVLRLNNGRFLFLAGDVLLERWGREATSWSRRVVIPGLADAAADGRHLGVLTPSGLSTVVAGTDELSPWGATPGAVRLVGLISGFVAWAPGSDRYYWFRGPEARVALTAPEPLRFVTANPGREMFCGIGVSGSVYCANDRQYRCDRVAVSSNGELVRREDVVGPASWIGIGPDHVCVVVDGEGWCWGENLLGPSPQRVTIDPELGPCLDVAVPLRLPIPES